MLPNEMPNENEPSQASSSTANDTTPQPDPIAANAANLATKDDLAAVLQSVQALASAIQQGVATRPAEAAVQQMIDPTDEEIIADLNSGKAGTIKRLTSNIEQRLLKQHIEPMQRIGMQRLAEASKDMASRDPNMPHFARFSKQIDQLASNVPLEQRDINCYRTAYNIVAGQNVTILIKEEAEKLLRAQNDGDGGQLPSGGRTRDKSQAGVPTVTELCGERAQADLDANGWTADVYAQKIYHKKNWAEAAASIKAFQDSEGANA